MHHWRLRVRLAQRPRRSLINRLGVMRLAATSLSTFPRQFAKCFRNVSPMNIRIRILFHHTGRSFSSSARAFQCFTR
jgi:hypothetical protein